MKPPTSCVYCGRTPGVVHYSCERCGDIACMSCVKTNDPEFSFVCGKCDDRKMSRPEDRVGTTIDGRLVAELLTSHEDFWKETEEEGMTFDKALEHLIDQLVFDQLYSKTAAVRVRGPCRFCGKVVGLFYYRCNRCEFPFCSSCVVSERHLSWMCPDCVSALKGGLA